MTLRIFCHPEGTPEGSQWDSLSRDEILRRLRMTVKGHRYPSLGLSPDVASGDSG